MTQNDEKKLKNMFLHRFEWFWMVFGPLEKIRQKNVTKILRLIKCVGLLWDPLSEISVFEKSVRDLGDQKKFFD